MRREQLTRLWGHHSEPEARDVRPTLDGVISGPAFMRATWSAASLDPGWIPPACPTEAWVGFFLGFCN